MSTALIVCFTVSICINFFQALLFWLMMLGYNERRKQLKELVEKYEGKEAEKD